MYMRRLLRALGVTTVLAAGSVGMLAGTAGAVACGPPIPAGGSCTVTLQGVLSECVAIEETFDTREEATTAWTSPETEQAMIADGIDMATVRVEYLEEVEAATL